MWTDMYGVACSLHFLITGDSICGRLAAEWLARCYPSRTDQDCDRQPIVLDPYPPQFEQFRDMIQTMLNMPFDMFEENLGNIAALE